MQFLPIDSRFPLRGLHSQEYAHAWRTKKRPDRAVSVRLTRWSAGELGFQRERVISPPVLALLLCVSKHLIFMDFQIG